MTKNTRMQPNPVVVVLAAVVVGLSGCASDPVGTPPLPVTVETGQRDLPAPVEAIHEAPAAPVEVTLDDHTAPVDAVATDQGGVLLPPQDVARLGWWVDSALPGAGTGSVVVVGHVDDVDQGDGFAARFTDLADGDTVQLTLADGSSRTYRVDRVVSVGKNDDLPLDEVNRLDGPETLILVTCGGEFVGPPLGYADNVFVFASLFV